MSNHEPMVKALGIYNQLLRDGLIDLNDNKLIFQDYESEEVKELLEIIAVESRAYIFENKKRLYLIPEIDNTLIAYSNDELKNSILGYKYKIPDLFVCYYIAISIFSLMYSAKGYLKKVKEYISVTELESIISKTLGEFERDENIEQIENENEFNIREVAKKWIGLKEYKDDKDIRQKSRIGFICCTCEFLSKHDILNLTNEGTQIRTTDKLDKIMLNYYTHPDREYKLINLLGGMKVG
jgi:hypothetical protein